LFIAKKFVNVDETESVKWSPEEGVCAAPAVMFPVGSHYSSLFRRFGKCFLFDERQLL
jgi:hypothetical protein